MKLRIRNRKTGKTKIMDFKEDKQSLATEEFKRMLKRKKLDEYLYEVLGEVVE